MGMQINDKIIGAAIIALVVLSGFAAYTFGHSSGYTGGYTTGNEEGYTKGDVAGYQKGFSDGNKTGYLSGYQSGYQSGQQAGYQSGYQSGQQVGFQSGRDSVEVDIFGNANRLNSAYNDAINLVSEIQQRCDVMGALVTKSC
jgi:flagellar biosynthesis/type III secretory pathway protein FliH